MKTLTELLAAFYADVSAISGGDDVKIAVVIATRLDGTDFHIHAAGSDPAFLGPMILAAGDIVQGKGNTATRSN